MAQFALMTNCEPKPIFSRWEDCVECGSAIEKFDRVCRQCNCEIIQCAICDRPAAKGQRRCSDSFCNKKTIRLLAKLVRFGVIKA